MISSLNISFDPAADLFSLRGLAAVILNTGPTVEAALATIRDQIAEAPH
jgi:hypothetical protein